MTNPAEPEQGIDVILCDLAALGTRSGFELAQWVRAHRPELEVRLAGSLDGIARTAADLARRDRASVVHTDRKPSFTISDSCGQSGIEREAGLCAL